MVASGSVWFDGELSRVSGSLVNVVTILGAYISRA
jgi:hypothetical protein